MWPRLITENPQECNVDDLSSSWLQMDSVQLAGRFKTPTPSKIPPRAAEFEPPENGVAYRGIPKFPKPMWHSGKGGCRKSFLLAGVSNLVGWLYCYLLWWFQILFIFTPNLGEMPNQINSYFIKWLGATTYGREKLIHSQLESFAVFSTDFSAVWIPSILDTIWLFPKLGVPQNEWFIMENTIKMDDLGGNPLFLETPICRYNSNLEASRQRIATIRRGSKIGVEGDWMIQVWTEDTWSESQKFYPRYIELSESQKFETYSWTFLV